MQCLGLVDAVQQVIIFLHFTFENIMANEENVGQAPRFIDVANNLSCL
jgi:hypothetical protein